MESQPDISSTQSDTSSVPPDMSSTRPQTFNVAQACDFIIKHYERGFKHLRFYIPMQIYDGSVAEFIDDDLKIVVASAKIRLSNTIHINKTSGDMYTGILLSDLAFTRHYIEFNTQ